MWKREKMIASLLRQSRKCRSNLISVFCKQVGALVLTVNHSLSVFARFSPWKQHGFVAWCKLKNQRLPIILFGRIARCTCTWLILFVVETHYNLVLRFTTFIHLHLWQASHSLFSYAPWILPLCLYCYLIGWYAQMYFASSGWPRGILSRSTRWQHRGKGRRSRAIRSFMCPAIT